MNKVKYKHLKEVCNYVSSKIKTDLISIHNYISTENMLPDKGGIKVAANLPDSNTVSHYSVNDILTSNIRPYFKKIWIATNSGGCSNDVLVLRAKKGTDAKFLYYVLSDNNFFNYSTVTSKGTKMPRGSKNAIMKYLIPDISIDTQNRIAEILSLYDDLIMNNNRRIELLENAAQEIYKEWFVRMRFPGHKMIHLENGIPQGWEAKTISEFTYVTDGTHDTPKPTDSGYYLVTGKSIINDFVDFSTAYYISEEDHTKIKKRSGLNKGDIIFSNIGTIGSVSIVDYDIDFSVKNVIILKPKSEIETSYLYCLLKNSTVLETFKQQANGSSQKFISLGYMRNYKILVPTIELINKFGETVVPIINEKINLNKQNHNLIKQRDLLLPRLMSGKLEV